MYDRRWLITAGILGAISIAFLVAVVAMYGWFPLVATLAVLAGTGACASIAVTRAERRRAHRAGMDLAMGYVRRMLDDAPELRTPVG